MLAYSSEMFQKIHDHLHNIPFPGQVLIKQRLQSIEINLEFTFSVFPMKPILKMMFLLTSAEIQ